MASWRSAVGARPRTATPRWRPVAQTSKHLTPCTGADDAGRHLCVALDGGICPAPSMLLSRCCSALPCRGLLPGAAPVVDMKALPFSASLWEFATDLRRVPALSPYKQPKPPFNDVYRLSPKAHAPRRKNGCPKR